MDKVYRTTAEDRKNRNKARKMASNNAEPSEITNNSDGSNTAENRQSENLLQTEIAHSQDELDRQANLLTRLPTENYRSLDSYKNALKVLGSPIKVNEPRNIFMHEEADENLLFRPKSDTHTDTQLNNTSLSKTDRTVIMELIRNLTNCSGSHEVELIQFLRQVGTIFSLAKGSDRETIKLILPKTSAFLFNIWLAGINNGNTWAQLHRSVLDTFFPSTQRHRIITNYIYRLQSPTENLIDYVQNIIDTTTALQIQFPEQELADIILSNVAPYNKKHFVMVNKPRNLLELRQLATQVNFSILSESNYNAQFYQAPQQVFPQTQQNYRGLRNNTTGVQCFRCQRIGHLAKNCYFQEN